MNEVILSLSVTAAGIGFFHTLLGLDHYLPFIMMSKAQQWSKAKTLWITFFSGIGHVLSSVVLGVAGYYLGVAVFHLEAIESVRGHVAAWMLLAFGIAYMVWGVIRLNRKKIHSHTHTHDSGEVHDHPHSHHQEHLHVHAFGKKTSITPWILFTIFVFGPCEPLIPLLIYPAAQESLGGMLLVATVFSIATIGAMMTAVMAGIYGLNFINVRPIERYMHVISGGVVVLCALGMMLHEH